METVVQEARTLVTPFPARLTIAAPEAERNRLTTAFRLILAIPHLLLVGGPMAAVIAWSWSSDGGWEPSGGGGVLGVAAMVAAMIAWFAIVFTGRQPEGLWKLAAFYLRWRVRAAAYIALLRDEYPPFGEGAYPIELQLDAPGSSRDRLSVAFRLFLAIPHILALWVLGLAWGLATLVAWVSIVFTGRYPESLYEFSTGMLRWSVRVEAYLLLLHDEYPPFSFE